MDRMTDSGSVDMGSIPVGGTKQYSKRLTFNKLSVYFFDRYNIGKTLLFALLNLFHCLAIEYA